VIELVLDASVLVKWFKSLNEQHVDVALEIYDRFSQGELFVVSPPLVFLELLNAASRRWGWSADRLEQFATDLNHVGLDVVQPSLHGIAHWCSRGLTAYDAAYVALAEERGTMLVTEDTRVIGVANRIARPLAGFSTFEGP
jgi:predicted nucleic acid-binding protein